MKRSLLYMVQAVLTALDSDEVNSIDDTIESQQVAAIIEGCYYEQLSNRDWPHMRKLLQLEASADLSRPNYLILPERLKQLDLLRYDVRKSDTDSMQMRDLTYREPDDFLRILASRNSSNANVTTVMDHGGSPLLIYNDQAPRFWTSFDDQNIVTDAYNKDIDDTLKKSKTQSLAFIFPLWERTDLFVPDLPAEAFTGLIEDAKSTASLQIKQTTDQKAEQKAGRQARWLSRKAWAAHGGVRYDNYGRKSQRGNR